MHDRKQHYDPDTEMKLKAKIEQWERQAEDLLIDIIKATHDDGTLFFVNTTEVVAAFTKLFVNLNAIDEKHISYRSTSQ